MYSTVMYAFNFARHPGQTAQTAVTLYPATTTIALVVGSYICARFLLRSVSMLLNALVYRGEKLEKYGAGQGAWAVVTGASHGIGREFALQLAQRGFNIALVSRTSSRLAQVAKEISELPGVNVKTIQHSIDFSTAGEEQWAALNAVIESLDVGILVNNAGMNHSPALFASVTGSEAGAVATVNATAAVRVASAVLPDMLAHRRGLILNIGSFMGGGVPVPFNAVYSGTKAFLLSWTQALGTELQASNSGVDIRAVHLGYVADGMADWVSESASIPSPERWVHSTLERVGLSGGAGRAFVSTPYWAHAFEEFVAIRFGLVDFARKTSYRAFAHSVGLKAKAQ